MPEEAKATLKIYEAMNKISQKNKEALEELKSYGDILPKKRKGKSTKPTAKIVGKAVRQERLAKYKKSTKGRR